MLGIAASGVLALVTTGCSDGDDDNAAGQAGSSAAQAGSMNGAGSPAAGGSSTNTPQGGGSNEGPDPSASDCDFVVYDGEPGSHPSSPDGLVYVGWPMETNHAEDITDAKFGSTALRNVLDPNGSCCGTFYYSWTNWDEGPGMAIDGAKFSNVELWIKVESGMYWNLQIEMQDTHMKSSFTGADVHIADYIDGKNIDMTWRHAKVPMSAFDTNGIDMAHISSLIIEGDRAVTFDLDDVKFTRDTCP